MKITVKNEITIASFRKKLHSSKLGTVYARAEGKATFAVETEDTEKDKVELTIGKEAELKVNDLLFGTHGAVSVSKGKLEFKFGLDDFEVTFEPSITNPVSFHIPAIKLPVAGKQFRLEKEIPSLGLTGSAEIEVEFVIEYHPDYRQLAKALKPSTVRASLQIAKNKLVKIAGKAGTVAKVVIKAGRAAIYTPFKMLGNSIGRKLALQSMKLGSQSAALRKLVGKAGRLLGAAGIVLEAWLLAKEAIPGVLGMQHKKIIDLINVKFADGYSAVLAAYTDTTAPLKDTFFDQVSKIERLASEPPDLYGVVETLSRTKKVEPPTKDVSDWRDDLVANGLKYRVDTMPLSEADWQALYREVYNIYMVFMDAAMHASGTRLKKVASDAIAKAYKLVEVAGMIAAYQDILAFVVSTSLYEDLQGNQPNDVWEQWKAVAEFHRAVFGDDVNKRIAHYMSLIDPGSLRVTIPPFGDYADWAQ